MSDLKKLANEWLRYKTDEELAVARRRRVEDEISEIISLPQEGNKIIEPKGFIVKISCRIDRKVDAEKVQDLAVEHGLEVYLQSLFRWKPEINMTVWKATDISITGPLAAAITAKPGRPSFKIMLKEVKK